MQIMLVLFLGLALLIAVFALQNAGFVSIRFLLWQFDVSLVLVILGSALLGALAAVLAGLFRRRARREGRTGRAPGQAAAAAPDDAPEKKIDG